MVVRNVLVWVLKALFYRGRARFPELHGQLPDLIKRAGEEGPGPSGQQKHSLTHVRHHLPIHTSACTGLVPSAAV